MIKITKLDKTERKKFKDLAVGTAFTEPASSTILFYKVNDCLNCNNTLMIVPDRMFPIGIKYEFEKIVEVIHTDRIDIDIRIK